MLRVDAHHHLWRYSAEEYGWIGDEVRPLRRDFLLDDLRAAMATANVDGTIAVQARQTVAETDWLLEMAASDGSPIRGVVGWLPIASSNFAAQLEPYAARSALKGLRHVVQAEPDGFLRETAFHRGMETLTKSGLVYEILIYARQLAEAIEFVDAHPRQAFVVDHIAKPDIRVGEIAAWARDIRALAERPNVCCKVSGMVTEADPLDWRPEQLMPYWEVVLDAFRPERLMIGTDWPVLTVGCSYAQWWGVVERWMSALTPAEQAMIFGETAQRVYGLKTSHEVSA